jgi:phage shock protein C
MSVRGRRFETDRNEGKLLGVCAGIANYTGIDATLVRIGAVVLTLAVALPWTFVAYFGLAFLGRPGHTTGYVRSRIAGSEDSRERMRSLDLRMQAIETCSASANSRLAREIEELR